MQVTDQGLLVAPDSAFGRITNGHLVRTDDLVALRCAVLLGEAGIGKSTELGRIHQTVKDRGDVRLIEVDLGAYPGVDELRRDLFENAEVDAWRLGDDTLCLLIDSLDEALLETPQLTGLLQRKLREMPAERLRLWITCRTAAWPESLTGFLGEVFGSESADVYELCPLQQSDVQTVARSIGVDPVSFINDVEERRVGPLAANPTTLQLLLRLSGAERTVPNSLVELYELGLTELCTPSPARSDRSASPLLNPQQMLDLASRIAATMALCRRSTVFIGQQVDLSQADVSRSELSAGETPSTPSSESIDAVLVETGLFSARGPHRFGFAHKTYGEFLAARYLNRIRPPVAQLSTLLYVADEDPPRLIPQLHEVAAWLASMNPEIFNAILEHEPEVLLMSDVATRGAAVRASIVEGILDRVQEGALGYRLARDYQRHFSRVRHPELASQLIRVIQDDQRHQEVRVLAIKIAVEGTLVELADTLAGISLDEQEQSGFREAAAYAVVELAVPSARQRMKSLATDIGEGDPDDQLRGCGLIATWPEYLTLDELLASLTSPKRPNFFGSYRSFLSSGVIEKNIRTDDLPQALAWAAELPALDHTTEGIADHLAYEALLHLEVDDIRHALARLILRRSRDLSNRFFRPLGDHAESAEQEDPLRRVNEEDHRLLLETLVGEFGSTADCFNVILSQHKFLRSGDIAWCFAKAEAASGDASYYWAHMARSLYRPSDYEHVELWLRYKHSCTAVAELMDWPESVELGSEEAERMKNEHEDRKRRLEQLESIRRSSVALDPPADERVRQVLERCLRGESELFWWLLDQMRLADSARGAMWLPDCVHDHPGWERADENQRKQMTDAARRFLREATINPADLMARVDGTRYVSERAPALATDLLYDKDPAFLRTLGEDRWKVISPFLLLSPAGDVGRRAKILEIAYRNAPEVIRSVTNGIIRRARDETQLFLLADLEDCLDEEFAAKALGFLRDGFAPPSVFRNVLGWLLRHEIAGAQEFAEQLLRPPQFAETSWPLRSRDSVFCLFVFGTDRSWDVFWPLIESYPGFGVSVLTEVVTGIERRSLQTIAGLSDARLGLLVTWLFRHVSLATETHEGAFRMSPIEELQSWRSMLLDQLTSRGTSSACAAIQRLREQHPDLPWLADVLLEAQIARRRNAWTPPSPRELGIMLEDSSRRCVGSGNELLAVIAESLTRFEEDLRGETPAVSNLWDEGPEGTCRPKGEEHLSDNIVRHLRTDLATRGVVVNREVQIRRRQSSAGQAGQRTDIHVDAVSLRLSPDELDSLKVIIEVKGCWHPEVRAAMRTQLVDRYLHENRCRHGMYAVGWFGCEGWDDGDRRKQQTRWPSLDAARAEIDTQAAELCADDALEIKVRGIVLDCALR